MAVSILFILLLVSIASSSSTTFDTLNQGSTLSVERKTDVLNSPNGQFSAGFFPIGDNAFCFAIWFTKASTPTVAWMANRDQPVNGRRSKLSLLKNGNLILIDVGKFTVWSTDTSSSDMVRLRLLNSGNLVIRTMKNITLWQSFDSPTDTLLPHQPLTKDSELISYRSQTNYSSGFYKLYFDNDNVLRLLFQGLEISGVYWPDPWRNPWENGRSTYNNSRIAQFSDLGYFMSSDSFTFRPSDFNVGPQRRVTLDFDGNLRMYSMEEVTGNWSVSWQVISQPCMIHGICGPNSLCNYDRLVGRRCSCLPGFRIKNLTDWSYGCEPEFKLSCNRSTSSGQVDFLSLPHVDLFGYDILYLSNVTLDECQKQCSESCDCKAFMFKFDLASSKWDCWLKFLLLNGHLSPNFYGQVYLKLPKSLVSNKQGLLRDSKLNCSGGYDRVELERNYQKRKENESVDLLLWIAVALGGIEISCIFLVWCSLQFKNNQRRANEAMEGYVVAATGFKKFTYLELERATHGFSEEIGRGGAGIVYKGVLLDKRVAAIKLLNEANQGEDEFQAEISSVGKLHHMNLIDMWGYCAEGKHRLLVYEYMEHGSLAENLFSNELNWDKRFEIALGTAKGMAYLHEECLEWILHCDIKPQNILLDSDFRPKVADFGLSKLLNRGNPNNNSSFSRIRGTRGYMAPEWVCNLPITSKVDVYSYGIVALEMITGKSLGGVQAIDGRELLEHGRLVRWVKEKIQTAEVDDDWILEILDPTIDSSFDKDKIKLLVNVALNCAEEDRDARPTMSQVVETLQASSVP